MDRLQMAHSFHVPQSVVKLFFWELIFINVIKQGCSIKRTSYPIITFTSKNDAVSS